MESDKQLSLLTKALEAGLLTAAQASELLQQYSADPTKSITSLMLSKGLVSEDRLQALTQSFGPPQTDGATAQSSPAVPAPDGDSATMVGREPPPTLAGTQPAGASHAEGTVQWSPEQLSHEIRSSVAPPAADTELSSEPRIHGMARYLLRKEVARGGLGRIVLAHDQHVGRDVALKELLHQSVRAPEKIERFFEEAQVTGQLEHPGIVPIYELGLKADGSPFYTMKFLRGQPYSAAIKAYHELPADDPKRKFRLRELLNVFVDICNAVGYAHAKGVLHRDLKPANVMLGDFGEALVVDWGLAKLVGAFERPAGTGGPSALVGEMTQPGTTVAQSAQSVRTTFRKRTEHTMVGTIAGTIPYMSPEQAMGKVDELDARSDVFSLGAILYEVLVGRPPYGGLDRSQLLPKVWECEFPPPRDVNPHLPKPLAAICLKALAKLPAHRYETARDLGLEVARWLGGEPIEAYPDPWWKRLERWVRRHPTLCGSTAAAIVVGISLVSFFAWREQQRIGHERLAVRDALAQGQEQYFAGEREAARDTLRQAKTIADREPRLADVAVDLNRFLERVEAELAQAAAQKASAERFAAFQKARDDASFYRTYLTGLPQAQNLKQTLAAADAALALYPGATEANVEAVTQEPHLNEQQRNEVLAGIRQMLFVKAGALAEQVPDQPPAARQANVQASLELLERARRLGITEHAYRRQRARSLAELGQTAEAKAEYAAAEKAPPRSAEDYFLLGLDRYALRDFPAAVAGFQDSLRLAPQQFWPQYYLAVCYLSGLEEWRPEGTSDYDRNNAGAAAAHLTALLSKKPDFEWIYVLRGAAFGATGNFAAAELDFSKALELKPDFYAVFVNRAMTRIQQQKFPEAIADLRRAIELEPGSHQAYVNLAEAYRRSGDGAAALAQADQLAQKFPNVVEGYRIRAYLRQEKGEIDAALADLDQATRRAPTTDPALADLHLQRARLLFLARRFAESAQAYQQALALRPADADREVMRGLPLMELAQFADALNVFNRFLKQAAPGGGEARSWAVAYRERGLAKAALKDPVGAVADYTLALAVPWQPQSEYDRTRMTFVRTRRGWAYLTEAAQLALSDFETLLTVQPNNAELYTGRGYAQALLGNLPAAVGDAEKALTLAKNDLQVRYNAACVVALAAGKASSPDGPPDVRPNAAAWRERAVALLRQILDDRQLPPAARNAVRQQLRADPAFDLIRTSPEFRALLTGK